MTYYLQIFTKLIIYYLQTWIDIMNLKLGYNKKNDSFTSFNDKLVTI